MKTTTSITMTRWKRSKKGNAYRKLVDGLIVVFPQVEAGGYMIRRRREQAVYSELIESEAEAKKMSARYIEQQTVDGS
jgi:hypothetical protein